MRYGWIIFFCAGFMLGIVFNAHFGVVPLRAHETANSERRTAVTEVRHELILPTRAPPVEPSDPLVRKKTLDWFRQRNYQMSVSAIQNDEVAEPLALILGLSPAEIQVLNSAIRQASESVRNLQLASATTAASSDGKKLIVTLPPIGVEGTEQYKALIATFHNILGPERYEVFNQVAGETFDLSFDHFGSDLITYEIALAPVDTVNGISSYKFERRYASADHTMHGTDGGVTTLANSDFVLKHFLSTLPQTSK